MHYSDCTRSESMCCPCEEVELRLYENYAKNFGNKYRIKNTIIVLCAKGVIKWMTMLTPIKSEDGNLRILRGDSYTINPEIIKTLLTGRLAKYLMYARQEDQGYTVAFLFL